MIQLPTYIQFETSTKCNQRCTFCPHQQMRARKDASMKQIKNIINTCVQRSGTPVVCPFGMQDPLLEPRLIEILHLIKARNWQAHTIIYTTMDNANTDLIQKLIESHCLDEIVISGPYGNKWQKGMDDERTNKNIEYLLNYKKKNNYKKPTINMHWIETIPGGATHRLLWGKKVNSIQQVKYDTFHGTMPSLRGSAQEGEEGCLRPCSRLWSTLNIHSDGNVVPCCIDYEPLEILGNINDTPIMDIWNGPIATRLRELHMEGKRNEIELCRNCEVE